MIYDSSNHVKEALARKLGHPVREDVWQSLEADRYVEEILTGEQEGLDPIAERYRFLANLFRESGPRRNRANEGPPDERIVILSDTLAKEAAKTESVRKFRAEVMGSSFLNRSEVEDWIKEQAEIDGPPTVYIRFPVPKDKLKDGKYGVPWADPEYFNPEMNYPVGYSIEMLDYGVPDKQGVFRIPITLGGKLQELKSLSVNLAKAYGWQQAQATIFVLTDVPPMLYQQRWIERIHWDRETEWKRTYFTAEIDPSTPPEAVEKQYRNLRSEIGQGHYRPMSRKHLHLSEFYGGEQSGKWKNMMDEWNSKHPEWPYPNVRNFSRDCRAAWKRLMSSP